MQKKEQTHRVSYNPQHQGFVKAFNRTVDFLTFAKYNQLNRYNFEDSIYDFLMYFNDIKHLTTQVVLLEAMMNSGNKELIERTNPIQ